MLILNWLYHLLHSDANFSSRCLYIVIYSCWFYLMLMYNLLLSNNSFHFGSSNNFTFINFWSFSLHSLINFRSFLCLYQLFLNSEQFSSILCHLPLLHKFCFCQLCLFFHGSFLGASSAATTITWLCLPAAARAGSLWLCLTGIWVNTWRFQNMTLFLQCHNEQML